MAGRKVFLSQHRHLLPFILRADERTGGRQAADAVAVGICQFKRIRRDDGDDGLVLFQGHDGHTLAVAGGLCGDLRRADQKHPSRAGADGQLRLLGQEEHGRQRLFVAVGFQQLAAVLLGGVGAERNFCALAAGAAGAGAAGAGAGAGAGAAGAGAGAGAGAAALGAGAAFGAGAGAALAAPVKPSSTVTS